MPLLKNENFKTRSLFGITLIMETKRDPSAIIRKGDWKLIHYFEDGKNELYHLIEDMGETNNIIDQFPGKGMDLKNELENWLRSTAAKIPKIDPQYDEEEEKKWLKEHKQKLKLKVERKGIAT